MDQIFTEIEMGDKIKIERSDIEVQMIDTGTRTFYGVLREKLNWEGIRTMAVIKIKENYCKGVFCACLYVNKSLVVSETINEYGLHPIKFREDAECDGCKKCAIMCPDVAIEIYN